MTTKPVTITLAIPTHFAIDPARLVAWLREKGYTNDTADDSSLWANYTRDDRTVSVPLHSEYSDYARCLCSAVIGAARREGLEPAALAALLAPPVEGPALQWQHASAGTRAPVLALLDRESRFERSDATRCRNNCEPELALAAEGRALGLEAAAAWLRGPAPTEGR